MSRPLSIKSEDRIQQECYMWFHNEYPDLRGLLFHPPNGGARNAREGAKFKTMGVYPGVSDFILLHAGRAYCIELKNSIGVQSKVQKEWEEAVKNQGFYYVVVRSLEEFKSEIERILNSKL